MSSLDEPAARITKESTQSALQFFQDAAFRSLLSFEKLEKNEQDRIFNELTVGALALSLLMLKTLESVVQEGSHKNFLKILHARIPKQYAEMLSGSGISEKNILLWEKLIALRTQEYKEEYEQHRQQLLQATEKNPWIAIIAVGCTYHLRRAEPSPKDPLLKKMLDWTTECAKTIEKQLRSDLRTV